jgi:hypothetical protein
MIIYFMEMFLLSLCTFYKLLLFNIISKLPPKGLGFMTTLFNSLLRLGYFPVKWKTANIILINKPDKDKFNPDSYRPISLLT